MGLLAVLGIGWVAADILHETEPREASSAAGQWTSVPVPLHGFVFVVMQPQRNKKERENHTRELVSQNTWSIQLNVFTTLGIFVERPELRP